MTKADADHRSEHTTFPPFVFFAFLVSLREEVDARSAKHAYDAAHFAAIAAEDAIAAECDAEWDNLIAHFETELRKRKESAR